MRKARWMVALLAIAIMCVTAAGSAQAATKGSCFVSVRAAGKVFEGTVTRSVRTSCPFARNVTRASLRFIIRHGGAGDGDFYVFAWSPVTGRWYHVHCFGSGDIYDGGVRVDCRAGLGARVIYRAHVV